jgi:signal transduction histidine kinase
MVAGYSLAAWGPRWAGVAGAVAIVGGAALVLAVPRWRGEDVPGQSIEVILGTGAFLAVTLWLAGTLRQAGRRNVEHLRERARLLEAEQAGRARLATLAERARISREIHDIVAHSLSVIIVQADGGRIAATSGGFGPGESAASVLGDIAGAGRSALADIRALLGLLHGDDAPPGRAAGAAGPQPGIEALPALVEEYGRTGLRVRLTTSGEPRALPAGAALTVYRAVQEALTNTVKHAGPASAARVAMAWEADHLDLRIDDDGPVGDHGSAPAAGSLGGRGLRGMRERVAAHGGSVESGPRPGGGFAVRVRLPYPPDPPPRPPD